MRTPTKFSSSSDLPEAVKRSLGIGRFGAKIFERTDGEMIAEATQDLREVVIRLTYIQGDRARCLELTETELRRVLLMARDVREKTGQKGEHEYEEIWLDQD